MSAPPHPRESFDWIGPDAHERAFADAMDRGRLHHAWLVLGPEGAGRATFAYRAARRLLGARPSPERGVLGAEAEDPVSRLVLGRSHPDLAVIQREAEDGRARRLIPVEEARELPPFFSKTPAAAPYRVAIVDTADDLNPASANALLKTLEEPPERGVIFLLARAVGGILPTLVSRCRRVVVSPPDREAAIGWVARRAEVTEAQAAVLLDMARGAPGGAWRLAAADAFEAARTAEEIWRGLAPGKGHDLPALAESFRFGPGAERFRLIFERLMGLVRDEAILEAARNPRRAEAWARAWTEMGELKGRLEAVNLDRAEAFLATTSRLRAIARAAS
ncbi:MAG: DNA polymerase III subunit [Alphaproteobacteria bacterium]|nr:DNA polymerase III subunit [Alphaproteobacteria bacterium]